MATREEVQLGTNENLYRKRTSTRYDNNVSDGNFNDTNETNETGDGSDSQESNSDEGEEELHVIREDNENFHNDDEEGLVNNNRPYQTELCKPKFTVGNITMGISQARLFGLLDENGGLKTVMFEKSTSTRSKKQEFIKANEMSKPREIDVEMITQDDETFNFKPEKSKEALRAMRNPRLGYDFLDRLNNRNGDFVQRMTEENMNGKNKKVVKGQLESIKADYTARLDKLACPACRKEQSFDEFFENKRECSQCPGKPRFTKLNITTGANFEKRLKEKEVKRLDRLADLDAKVYGMPSNSSKCKGKVTTGVDFEKRVKEQENKRLEKLNALEANIYGSVQQQPKRAEAAKLGK